MYSTTSTNEVVPPSLPSIKLKEIETLAEDLLPVFRASRGQQVTNALASRWAYEADLSIGTGTLANLEATFQQYTGRLVDDKFAFLMAWQIAARHQELRKGLLVTYERPSKREWILCDILRVESAVWREDQLGSEFHMLARTGHPAGHILKRKFPNAFLRFFAYQLGFSRRVQFEGDPRHFIGLRFWGFLVPNPETNEVEFTSWELSSKIEKDNRAIIKVRTRFETGNGECPRNLENTCFDCTVRRKECPASIHP